MLVRRKAQFGLTALVAMVGVGFAACTGTPPGRTEDCYWFPPPQPGPVFTTTTTPSTIPEGWTFRCVDPDGAPSTTLYGYPAPIPAGTRTVK